MVIFYFIHLENSWTILSGGSFLCSDVFNSVVVFLFHTLRKLMDNFVRGFDLCSGGFNSMVISDSIWKIHGEFYQNV